jgi:hypothetical protein
MQKILRSDRLHLVPLSDDHLENEVELDSDQEIMRYLGNGMQHVRTFHQNFEEPRRQDLHRSHQRGPPVGAHLWIEPRVRERLQPGDVERRPE